MKRLLQAAALCLAVAAPGARAADAAPAGLAGLAGHYYLEKGPGEVGSELLLKAGGRFEWALTYGASDFAAGGTWHADGGRVVLKAAPAPAPVFRLFRDDEYGRTKPAEPGRWIAVVGVPMEGPLQDIEVRFEARSGKAAAAVTKPNGDAIVTMPAAETWTRTGLRRSGSDAPWQWFDVPQGRAGARLVGFALTNLESLMPPPFDTVKLRVEPDGLAIDGDLGELRGTYVKH